MTHLGYNPYSAAMQDSFAVTKAEMLKSVRPKYYLYETSQDVWHITTMPIIESTATLCHVGSFDECKALKAEFDAAVRVHEGKLWGILNKCKRDQ